MTTTAAQDKTQQRGIGGIFARLRAGTLAWGVFHPGSWFMITGGLMLIVAAFSPWIYVTLTQQVVGEAFVLRGTDGPGVATLALGFLAFAGGFVPRRKLAIAHAAIPGALVALIILVQAWNIITASMQTAWGSFLPGMGVVLAGGGAVILLRGSWKMYRYWTAAPQKK